MDGNSKNRLHYLDLSPNDIRELSEGWGLAKFRGKQLLEWIFQKRAHHPAQMTNLPQTLRGKLAAELDWELPAVHSRLNSEDGTTKLILQTARSQAMETVIMRYEGRTSLCVSSQVGCRLACSFCQTGKMGFMRHLTKSEILGQYVAAQKLLDDAKEGRRISHVVFMGMGEPLDNYGGAVGAASSLIDNFGLSHKNVTVSTSGVVPRIYQLSGDCAAALAVSLHAARDDLRTSLMPINRKYNLAALKDSLLAYQKTTGKKITLEYILIKDVNCSRREAKDLVRFIHGLRVKVNLIPFNDHPGVEYQRPAEEDIRAFQAYLTARSIPAPVRYSRGLGVSAACGQLAAKRQESLGNAPERRSLLLGTDS